MPGEAYPRVPMYRYPYTKLTEAQISARFEPAAARGPSSAGPSSDVFAGKTLKIVTDKGPALAYAFKGPGRLTVSENGGKAVQAGYGAETLGRIALLTHLIPGTQRGYAVVVDQKSGLATVFELWFSGYQDKREVQREVYFGYVDQGGPAPKGRHAATNRVEGKGFWWKQDNGIETLEFYPSAAYSHFVELTRLGPEQGYCAPTDYIKIDDDYFVYARVEAELSGIMTLYAADLNRVEQAGLRLGFNGADELEYYVFKGKGEWLGQIAQFEKFGDEAGNVVPPPPNSPKGARRVYRPLQTLPKMTPAQVNEVAAKSSKAFETATPMNGNGLPTSDVLAGRSFTFRYDDGPVMDYRVDGPNSLQWRKDGGAWTAARYEAREPAPGIVVFGHLLAGTPDHDGHCIVADFDEGLVTCFNGHLNTPYFANEAGAKTRFGTIEGPGLKPPPRLERHGFTDELLGHCITWNYAPGLTSMHLYSTPHTLSWIIFTEAGAGGLEWCGPAAYVKIRDGMYFAYWLEEACNGTLGTIFVNMRTMHDTGVGYHCGAEGLSMSAVGAHGRHAGKFDVARFYPLRTGGSQ